jgi:hypothetical protein
MKATESFPTEIEFGFRRNQCKRSEVSKKPTPLFEIKAASKGTLKYEYSCETYLSSTALLPPPPIKDSGHGEIKVKGGSFTQIRFDFRDEPGPGMKSDEYPYTEYIYHFTISEDSPVKVIEEIHFCIDKSPSKGAHELNKLYKLYDPNIVSIESLCENSILIGFKREATGSLEDESVDSVFKLPQLESAAKAFKNCKFFKGYLPGGNLFGSPQLQPPLINTKEMFYGDSELKGDLLDYVPLQGMQKYALTAVLPEFLVTGMFVGCSQLKGNFEYIFACMSFVGLTIAALEGCNQIMGDKPVKKIKKGLYVFRVRVSEENKNNFSLVRFEMNIPVDMKIAIAGDK